jgi:hypothetical protein
VTYTGNTTLKHGNNYGDQPTGTVLLAAGEQISSIFGKADHYIRSIGFTTTWGAVLGPWGDTAAGQGYSISGPVYGLYGGLWGDVLGSLGTWTTDPAPYSKGSLAVTPDAEAAILSALLTDSASPQPAGTPPASPLPSRPPPLPPPSPSPSPSVPWIPVPMSSSPLPKALQYRIGAGSEVWSDGPNFSGAHCLTLWPRKR